MKLSFWDILASMVMLGGLAMATIFINIFINPYSFINPFPPPTPVASLQVPTLTPSQRSLPELWTATPETPGVPSVTSVYTTGTATATGTRLILPTGTATRTKTAIPIIKTATKTPNRTLTSIAYLTPTKTTSSGDDEHPTTPGTPTTSSSTSVSTPVWSWTKSTDNVGVSYYQVTWGGDTDCNNTSYTTTSRTWTAPAMTAGTTRYICVRAVDAAGNKSDWAGPSGFTYALAGAPSATTNAATSVNSTSAVLNGLINANSHDTTVFFQYGTTTSYGTTQAGTPATVTGSTSTAVSYTLTGLTPNTTYHFRVYGTNSVTTTYGADVTFKTLGTPTTTTITGISVEPSVVGQSYTVSVSVAPVTTGTVSVSDGTGAVCSPAITLSGGTGTCTLTSTTAGTKTISAIFSGNSTYATSTGTATHQVDKGTPIVSVWPSASAISYGQTLASSTLSGGAAIPSGTFSWIDPSVIPALGTSSQNVRFTPSNSANYNTVDGTVNVTVNKANQTTLVAHVDHTPVVYNTTAELSTTGGSGTGAVTFNIGSSTGCALSDATHIIVTNVGGTCVVTATKADDGNYYEATSAPLTIALAKADPVTTWPTGSTITYGALLGTSILSGETVITSGTLQWVNPTTVPPAGDPSYSVSFTPDDTTNYNTVTHNVSLHVNKATPTVDTWPTASAINAGQALSASTLSGGHASVAGSFAFESPTTVPGATGPQNVVFTPVDSANYESVLGSVTVTVNP